MGSSGRPASVRERLLATADDLFYAEGIRAVGIDRVIAESAVAKSTMYVHFRTKEDLVAAYLRRRSATWRTGMADEITARATDPTGRLLAIFDVLGEAMTDPGYRGCPFSNAAAEYPHHDDIQAAVAEHRRWLHDLFDGLLGQDNRTDALVTALIQLYDGAMTTGHLDHTVTAASTARATASILLRARS